MGANFTIEEATSIGPSLVRSLMLNGVVSIRPVEVKPRKKPVITPRLDKPDRKRRLDTWLSETYVSPKESKFGVNPANYPRTVEGFVAYWRDYWSAQNKQRKSRAGMRV